MPPSDKANSSRPSRKYYAATTSARRHEVRGDEESARGYGNMVDAMKQQAYSADRPFDQYSEYYSAAQERVKKCVREEDERRWRCQKRLPFSSKPVSAMGKKKEQQDAGKTESSRCEITHAVEESAFAEQCDSSTEAVSRLHAYSSSSLPPPPSFVFSAMAGVQTPFDVIVPTPEKVTVSLTDVIPPVLTAVSHSTANDAEHNTGNIDKWADLHTQPILSEHFSAFNLPDLPPSSRRWTYDDDLEEPDALLPPAARLQQNCESDEIDDEASLNGTCNLPGFGKTMKRETFDFLSSKTDENALSPSDNYSLFLGCESSNFTNDVVPMDTSCAVDNEFVPLQRLSDRGDTKNTSSQFRLRRPPHHPGAETGSSYQTSSTSASERSRRFNDARAVIEKRRLECDDDSGYDVVSSENLTDATWNDDQFAQTEPAYAKREPLLLVANERPGDFTHATVNAPYAVFPVYNADNEPYFSVQNQLPSVSQIHEANETAERPVFTSAADNIMVVAQNEDALPTCRFLSYPLLKFFRITVGEMLKTTKRMRLRDFYTCFTSNLNAVKRFDVMPTADDVERIIMRQCSDIATIRHDAEGCAADSSSSFDTAVLHIKPHWRDAAFAYKPSAEAERKVEHEPAVFLKIQERLRSLLWKSKWPSNTVSARWLYDEWNVRNECTRNLAFKSTGHMCAILRYYFTDTVEVSDGVPDDEAAVSLLRDAQFPSLTSVDCSETNNEQQQRRRYTYLSYEYLKSFRNRRLDDVHSRRDMRLREIVRRMHKTKIMGHYGALTVANFERIVARQCCRQMKLTYDAEGLHEYVPFVTHSDSYHEVGDLFVRFISSGNSCDSVPRSFMVKYQNSDDERRQAFIQNIQKALYELLTSVEEHCMELSSLLSAWWRSSRGKHVFKFADANEMHDVLKYCFSDIVSLFSSTEAAGFGPECIVALVRDAKFPSSIVGDSAVDISNSRSAWRP